MISIIVPIYNVEKYLIKCIESIVNQTFKELEIILVDDGSTDMCSLICDEYAESNKCVKVIHKENGGLVSARKAGISVASGEYISFVDADDWIEPDMIEQLYNLAKENQGDMVVSGYIEDIGENRKRKLNSISKGIYDKQMLEREVYPRILSDGVFFSMGIQPYIWNKVIKKEIAYEVIMSVDNRIQVGEDVVIMFPALLKSEKVVVTDYCGYHYCIRNNSMMWKEKKLDKERQGIELLHQQLQKNIEAVNGIRLYEKQLEMYSVNNILTRCYSEVAERDGKLFPFNYEITGKKLVIYGAGNFGRAVYEYLQSRYGNIVSLWIDKEHENYNYLGLPVSDIKNIKEFLETDILIAVLNIEIAKEIANNLIQRGIIKNRIYRISNTVLVGAKSIWKKYLYSSNI